MKTKLTVLGLLFAASSFTACEVVNPGPDGPANVAGKTEILMKKFPNAEGLYWHKSKDNRYDIATFKLSKNESRAISKDSVEVWFGDTEAMRLIEQEIAFKELPADVQAKFNTTQSIFNKELYSNTAVWTLDDVCRLERDNAVSYKIEVEDVGAKTEVDIYFDEQGILLKEVEDKDEDEEDEAPLEIPANIATWINTNYPKAEVLDYESDVEEGVRYHELDLKEGVIIIEIELMEKGTELTAVIEYNYPNAAALPADVLAKLQEVIDAQTVFALTDIEDIEMTIEAGAEVYSFDFEKADAEAELEIIKNSDGTFVVGKIEIEGEEEEEEEEEKK